MQIRLLKGEYALAISFAFAILIASIFAVMPRFAEASSITATTTIASSNASTTLAKSGDTLTIKLNMAVPSGLVPTSTPLIQIGSLATVSMGATTTGSTATNLMYSFSSSTAGLSDGTVTYTITRYSDSASSASTTITQTSAPTGVRLDTANPSITSASITSANSSSTIAKSGDILTLTATTSQQLMAGLTVTLAGNSVQLACTPGSDWSQPAVCTATTAAPASTGAVTFSLTPVDLAGNAGAAYTTVTGPGVYVYGTAPALTVTGSNPLALYANNSTGYSDAGATATDAQGNSIGVSTTANNVNPANAGTYSVSYSATDAAGNVGTASRTVTVTAPGGGGPVAGSFGGSGGGSLIPVLPGTTPITQTSAPGVNPSGATSTPTTVNQLMQQLAALQAQLATLTGGTTTFTRNLTVGSTGSDVMALQQYLNRKGYEVAASGPGSVGMETSRFGPATKAALAKFQAAVSISPASGYFGAKTRAYVNANQ